MFTSTVHVVEKEGRLYAQIDHQAHGDLYHRVEIALPKRQSKTLEDAEEAAEVLQRQLIMLVRHTAALVSKEWEKDAREFIGIQQEVSK